MTKKKKVVLIAVAVAVLAVLCGVLLIVSGAFKDKAQEGSKEITVKIISERDDFSFSETYKTDDEFLGDFLDEQGLIGFENSTYGRYIKSAKGYEANDDEQSWWCISVNGESSLVGVDEIAITDGDEYLLELKIGW